MSNMTQNNRPEPPALTSGIHRLLHTMLRVKNLQQSEKYYTEILGMKVLRKKDYPDGQFTLVFLGYGNESTDSVLELTYNWGDNKYVRGNAYGHIAIQVDDVYQACETIRNKGGTITREPGPMKHGSTILAFCQDPDGYSIELLSK